MIDGSVLQSAQRCFEKKTRVVMKMVVKPQLETLYLPVREYLKVTKWSDILMFLQHFSTIFIHGTAS